MEKNPIDDILGPPNPIDSVLGAPPKAARFSDTEAAVRGFGQGATAGLIQYPQAAIMAASQDQPPQPDVRSMPTARRGSMPRSGYFGAGDIQQPAAPVNQVSTSLADLRLQNKQMAEENQAAWYGGNIAGAAGLGLVTGGGGTVASLGKLGAQGAVSGFTQDEDIVDALKGAGIGLAFGAGGKLVSMGTTKIANSFKETYIKPLQDQIPGLTEKQAFNMISRPLGANKYGGAIANITDQGWQALKGMVAPAVGGGSVGAGQALIRGQDPVEGALIGAGTVVGATKAGALANAAGQVGQKAAMTIAKNPQIAEKLATGGTVPLTQMISGIPNQSEVVELNPIDEILGTPVDTRSNLRKLIDRFK